MRKTTNTTKTAFSGSLLLATELSGLRSKLEKVEKELSKCRTSTIEDGWQTQTHDKKSRKWDVLAQMKMKLIQEIEDYKEYECTDCGQINNVKDNGEITVGFCSKCGHPLWNDVKIIRKHEKIQETN